MGITAAVLGASGYAGGELVRLIDEHPTFEVGHLGAHSQAGSKLGTVHPQLLGGDRLLEPMDVESLPSIDVAFLALPHGRSWEIGHQLSQAGVVVVDLGSDYRMDTDDRYRSAYGAPHPLPDELSSWSYGIPELYGEAVAESTRIAAPGCYPTAALLGIAPLVAQGVVGGTVVVDAMSGVTGAGRGVNADLTFGAIDEGVRPYAIGNHRHRPEIEMGLEMVGAADTRVQFTPHLVPMQRGLLSTASAALTGAGSPKDALDAAYADAPFVDVIDVPPQTRWTVGSNRALVHAVEDPHTARVIVTVALDNLLKGAAGQAVQCANLAFSLPEDAGLVAAGWLP